MADFLTEGNKTVKCREGHFSTIPLNTTVFKCPDCGEYVMISYFGTIAGHFY